MTRDELRGIIEGISDEQLKKILDINSEDIGKAKAGAEELKNRLEVLNVQNASLEGEIAELKEGQREADKVREKIEELQKVVDQKNEAEKEANLRAELKQRFEAVAKDASFVNDFTRAGIFEQFKEAIADEKNIGKDDSEIYKKLTTGKENIFVPDGGVPAVVASTMGFGGMISDDDVREIMGLPNLD